MSKVKLMQSLLVWQSINGMYIYFSKICINVSKCGLRNLFITLFKTIEALLAVELVFLKVQEVF